MPMKLAVSAGALFLLLGTIAPAYAQREQQEKEQGKPQQGQQERQQPQKEQAKPAQQQHSRRRINLRNGRNKPTAAPIMAASSPTAPLMAASTTAAFRNTKDRYAAVSCSLAPIRGITTTAPGSSAAAITATGFLKTASGSISGVITSSASAAFR